MNEEAIPLLIAFLTVAGIAAFLLRRALISLGRKRSNNEAGAAHVSPEASTGGADARFKP